MNEPVTSSQSNELDTGELSLPVEPMDASAPATNLPTQEDDAGATGKIEIASFGDQDTDKIGVPIDEESVVSLEIEPKMRVAKRCHVGAVRERNEDSCLVFVSETGGHYAMIPFGLYIVADGMGGHANGHIASKTASRVAARHIVNRIYLPLLQDESSSYQPSIQEVMTEAVQAANAAVYGLDPDNDSGTTLTIALVLGRRLHIAHVGDSRIYLFSDDKLEIVSTDHSLVQRLQDVGQLTAEEATYYQYRHVLLRAVGQTEELEVDTYMRRLPKTGRLLLCSDGLPTMVSDSIIGEIMGRQLPAEETVEQLLTTALDAGGYDNVTAVLVDFEL